MLAQALSASDQRGDGGVVVAIYSAALAVAALVMGGLAVTRRRRRSRALRGEVVASPRRSWRGRTAFTIHDGRLAMARGRTRFVFTGVGIRAERDDASACFDWDHVVAPVVPLPRRAWTMFHGTNNGQSRRTAVALRWGPGMLDAGHPFNRSLLADSSVSMNGPLPTREVQLCRELLLVLRDQPNARRRLDDRAAVERLLLDIATWDPIFEKQFLGGIRRETVEIHAAMQKLGFVHRYGRPLPGDVLPELEDAVARVEQELRDGPYTRDHTFPREDIVEHLRGDYLAIEPWPFAALVW